MSPSNSIARYLFTRLRQHGVHSIFGVPGDFTLKALDHVKASGLKWIGNCNELNAAYAADGYARTRGLAAVVTTYGVGELSAINAIAGSYAEHVPVVHIVGTPQRHLQDRGAHVHHTLGDGRARIFAEMHRHVTVEQANLVDVRQAKGQIDHAIERCLFHCRPVYIELPCDMVSAEISRDATSSVMSTLSNGEDSSVLEKSKDVARLVFDKLSSASQSLLLVDRGDGVQFLKDELNVFVKASGIPTLTMPSGGGMIDHSISNYYGVHSGPVGQINTLPFVESADLVIAFGPMFSDTQTLGWKVVPDSTKTIVLGKNYIQLPTNSEHARVGRKTRIDLRQVLASLTEHFTRMPIATQVDASAVLADFRTIRAPPLYPSQMDGPIDQTTLYLRLNPYLQPNDTVILGNATPILGGRDFVLPPDASMIASGMWFSIGHMLPAALGIAIAKRDDLEYGPAMRTRKIDTSDGPMASDSAVSTVENKQTCYPRTVPARPSRVILFEGDGSFQTTCQELSTIIAQRLHGVTVFIVNNSGYAYERQIHGLHEAYNDIAPWRYLKAGEFFGASLDSADADDRYKVDTFRMETWVDLQKFLADEKMNDGVGLKLVEIVVGQFDVPEKFLQVFKAAGEKL